jgi:hypothetical protein
MTKRATTRLVLAAASAAILLLFSMPAMAQGNAGTVKVQDDSETGNMSNDPHVGCDFSVEGFNMAATSGTIRIVAWPPEGDHETVVLTANWTADGDEGQAEAHFVSGPFSLPAGHYKVFASNTGGHEKMKVFWVDCEAGTTSPPTAPIPVFPTTAALALGSMGALGGAYLVLRRR